MSATSERIIDQNQNRGWMTNSGSHLLSALALVSKRYQELTFIPELFKAISLPDSINLSSRTRLKWHDLFCRHLLPAGMETKVLERWAFPGFMARTCSVFPFHAHRFPSDLHFHCLLYFDKDAKINEFCKSCSSEFSYLVSLGDLEIY